MNLQQPESSCLEGANSCRNTGKIRRNNKSLFLSLEEVLFLATDYCLEV
jgi:hypothetical protein